MKGGFSGDRRILAMGVLTKENAAFACEARHLGGLGACPLRKILDFRPSEIVSGAIWK